MKKNARNIDVSASQALRRARALNRLRWPLRLTWIGMLAERVTLAFWPFWSVIFVLWSALSFGLQDILNLEAAYILTLTAAVAVIWTLISGVRKFKWPRSVEAIDRLDRSMQGQPLTSLWDNQAIGQGDLASKNVWDAHLARMANEIKAARAVQPDLKISRFDPFALRYLAATALVAALFFGSINRSESLINTLDPDGNAALVQGPIFEGWIEPPGYTGLPTIYLNDLSKAAVVPVPTGSKVILRLYGQANSIEVRETVSGVSIDPAVVQDETGREFIIRQNGSLSLTGPDNTTETWRFDVIPDKPPSISLTDPVERTPNGEMELKFTAADDYGVTGGTATLTIDLPSVDRRYGLQFDPEPVDAVVLDLPLPYTGNTLSFDDVLVEDLSTHVFAGLPVLLDLQVDDAAGQSSANEPETIIMPGRRFFDPTAAAIAEQRRDLLWNRKNAVRVSQVLRATTNHPEDLLINEKAYLVIRSALRRLEFNMDPSLGTDVRDDVADLLWRAALLLEDGDVSNAAERLRRAQERLSEALENGATEEEIARLMDELRQATREYLEALARDAEQNPDQQNGQIEPGQEITSDQLQELMDRIQELAEQGRTDEAQALLEQLRQMMENIQTARRDPSQPGQGPGQQSLQDLQDMLRQQQDLSDEAFRQLQEQFNADRQGQNGQSSRGQQNGEDGQTGRLSPGELARRQEALRQLLEQQQGQIPGSDSEEGRAMREALDRAEREMGAARDNLEDGDTAGALDNQAGALDALRDGIQNLSEDIARDQNQNNGQQGDQAGSYDPDSRRDPLGRQVGTSGRIGSDENILPGEDIFRRSREIIDEIRRRSGERSRPKIELDYLERLLDRF